MNFAPWMSPESYLWQGLAILAASLVLIVWVYGLKIQGELKHLRAAVVRRNL